MSVTKNGSRQTGDQPKHPKSTKHHLRPTNAHTRTPDPMSSPSRHPELYTSTHPRLIHAANHQKHSTKQCGTMPIQS